MKWPAPQARSLADQVTAVRHQLRDVFFGLDSLHATITRLEERVDSLHATITRLEERVRFLEEHAQLAQFKREEPK